MSGHVRYRHCGDSAPVRVADCAAKKPFRKTDLSGKEELMEARAELARLESMDRMLTQETIREFPDLRKHNLKIIDDLRKKVVHLDFFWNDAAAPAPAPITLAQINERNRAFYGV